MFNPSSCALGSKDLEESHAPPKKCPTKPKGKAKAKAKDVNPLPQMIPLSPSFLQEG